MFYILYYINSAITTYRQCKYSHHFTFLIENCVIFQIKATTFFLKRLQFFCTLCLLSLLKWAWMTFFHSYEFYTVSHFSLDLKHLLISYTERSQHRPQRVTPSHPAAVYCYLRCVLGNHNSWNLRMSGTRTNQNACQTLQHSTEPNSKDTLSAAIHSGHIAEAIPYS